MWLDYNIKAMTKTFYITRIRQQQRKIIKKDSFWQHKLDCRKNPISGLKAKEVLM